jgi:hypothetical protein
MGEAQPMTDDEQCDEAAATLCRAYFMLESCALLVRTTPDGNVRVIAPQLPKKAVAKMLHTAADAYLAQAPDVTSN